MKRKEEEMNEVNKKREEVEKEKMKIREKLKMENEKVRDLEWQVEAMNVTLEQKGFKF